MNCFTAQTVNYVDADEEKCDLIKGKENTMTIYDVSLHGYRKFNKVVNGIFNPPKFFLFGSFFILLSDIEIVKFVVMYKTGMFVSLIVFFSLVGETC